MPDFSYLKPLHVDAETTAKYTFHRIEGAPKLVCTHAGSTNPPFFSAVLKKSKDAARRMRARKDAETSQADMEETRQEDAELFAEYIVKDWEDVPEADGSIVPYSQEHVLEFLLAIPLDMFDDFRRWCLNIENFRPRRVGTMGEEEKEVLKGN